MCCCPEGYEPDHKTIKMVNNAELSNFEISHDPYVAVNNSDIIYTDGWASMGQKEEAKSREKIFSELQVNSKMMNMTNKETLFMHCLPAERGREVTDEGIESSNSIVFDQAENRMHAQNAIMLKLFSQQALHD